MQTRINSPNEWSRRQFLGAFAAAAIAVADFGAARGFSDYLEYDALGLAELARSLEQARPWRDRIPAVAL